MAKERNYGIDLLRIVSMYMVVVLHVLKQGGILDNIPMFGSHYGMSWLLEIACYCAVNCYALISGYVGIDSDKYDYKRIIILWLQVFFYSVLITFGFYIINPASVGKKEILQAIFPVMYKSYWYFTAYFALFFFIPILNHVVNTMERMAFRNAMAGIWFVLTVLQTLFSVDVFGTASGYSLIWLIVLYLLGGYIKKYQPFEGGSQKKRFLVYLACVMISLIWKWVAEWITYSSSGEVKGGYVFIKYTSPTIIIEAVMLLMIFSELRINGEHMRKMITRVAALSFGVYLIHVHPMIWIHVIKDRFAEYVKWNFVMMILAVIGTAIGIYVVCIFIDYIRSCIFKLFTRKTQ